ncbi:MAG: hypothetical protein AAF991_07330 [Pseudomonadota bacterium]
MLNRSALILRPGPSFIEWCLSLDDSGLAPSPDDEQTVYLIPDWGDEVEALEILSNGFGEIFERELDGWCTDESTWPKNRTFAMFREWFIIEFHSVVEDLCAYPIEDDEFH